MEGLGEGAGGVGERWGVGVKCGAEGEGEGLPVFGALADPPALPLALALAGALAL